MIYELAHTLQKHFPFLWKCIEAVNGRCFKLLFGKKLKRIPQTVSDYPGISMVSLEDVSDLAFFFSKQPEASFKYFRPHGFDEVSLRKLISNPSFLMYIIRGKDAIIGYFFLRCFFTGKAFLGKMVDSEQQGRGIGKMMCSCAMDIATALGLRMFESISKDNLASLYSSQSVLNVRVIKEMDNDYLYLEDLGKKSESD